LLVVNEFVDELFCQQQPETARPETLSFAHGDMTEQIAGWAIDRCMAEVFERETLAWIFDSARDRALNAPAIADQNICK
jgi:hypothetical protein